jgi:Na+/proline symporter
MLSYFGTDQSQVQRYLSAKSVDEARSSLLMSAYWKIPLQALILLIGVGVFLFYVFQPAPLLFNPTQDRAARAGAPAAFAELDAKYSAATSQRLLAAEAKDPAAFAAADREVTAVRSEALAKAQETLGQPTRDVNYIIPRFVLDYLPLGLAGLFLAAVLAAAMSSIAAELNSLATATTVDFYQRWVNPNAGDAQSLKVGKLSTMLWGVFACVVAGYAATLGSLIEVVNRFGSFFYGSILGVFVLAMIPRARGIGAFVGLIAGMVAVGAVAFGVPSISFLWHNVIGVVVVVIVGLAISLFEPPKATTAA